MVKQDLVGLVEEHKAIRVGDLVLERAGGIVDELPKGSPISDVFDKLFVGLRID